MKYYPIEKYKFYIGPGKVVAVSSYAGRRVRGVAKCSPEDRFDIERGKKLAAARCALKIAEKRKQRAQREVVLAHENYAKAAKREQDMNKYYIDANNAIIECRRVIKELLEEY